MPQFEAYLPHEFYPVSRITVLPTRIPRLLLRHAATRHNPFLLQWHAQKYAPDSTMHESLVLSHLEPQSQLSFCNNGTQPAQVSPDPASLNRSCAALTTQKTQYRQARRI